VAVRRRPSYGFDLAGTSFGVRPEAGVSRSTLAQLFPELDLKEFAPTAVGTTEQVEKPQDSAAAATPGVGGVTPIEDDTIPGSEFEKYKLSGELSYAAPFNIQIGPTGPQGRGSRLGYSGSAATTPSLPTITAPTQSASSVPLPEYKMPEIDLSPYENALAESQNIISGLSQQLSDIMASYKPEAQNQQQAVEETKPTETQTTTTTTPATTTPAPLRLQIKEAAEVAGKPTTLGKTGVVGLISGGADVNKIEQQARAAGVTLGEKAQSAVDRAQVKQIAAAPVSLQQQVQQIAKATESGKITQAAVNALISSGTSAAKIERVAEKQGIDIGRQAQQLINKAQDNKKKK
jgi:hypothetical protein